MRARTEDHRGGRPAAPLFFLLALAFILGLCAMMLSIDERCSRNLHESPVTYEEAVEAAKAVPLR